MPDASKQAPSSREAAGTLTAEVRAFLIEHVASVAQLEILVLLHDEGAALTPSAIASRLGVDLAWASGELAGLAARGMLQRAEGASPTYRYAPSSDAMRRLIGDVVRAYRARRVAVIDIIATKPSAHILGFADAFRLRKE